MDTRFIRSRIEYQEPTHRFAGELQGESSNLRKMTGLRPGSTINFPANDAPPFRAGRVIRIISVFTLVFGFLFLFQGCDDKGMQDGYYTAEALNFDAHGWKEFVTVYIDNGSIVTVEYNAKNPGGFIKSWDPGYVREMEAVSGTYPDEYTRAYAASLLQWQTAEKVDALTGATESWVSFRLLAEAALNQSRRGEKQVALVAIPETGRREEP
jgi:major membrane immunogen (membrane-anchored lipoprotein)